MIGISFFIEQFLGLVTGEIWDCSKEKIRTAYKNHKNAVEETKTFETHMYTAIVDAFCYYANINPQNARPDIMDFIYTTAEIYFNESHTEKADSTTALLHALNILDSKFGDTALIKNYENEKEEDKAKIETVANYLQKYIVKDEKFRDEYINEVLGRLLKINHRIEKKQLEHELFPEQITAVVKEAEHNIISTTVEESDRIIASVSNKIDSFAKERFSDSYIKNNPELVTTKIKFKDAKAEYVKKWNERLFLHRKPKNKELRLSNTFIPPLCKVIIPEDKQSEKPQDCFYEIIEQFIENGKSLLLVGQPGIGKTSIVCYLANRYKHNSDVIILRFSDWTEEEWNDLTYKTHGSLLFKAITHKLKCSERDLKNKILILDGFDEIKFYSHSNDLLKSFLLQIRSIRGLRVLITTRDNYINLNIVKFQNVIKLCPFNENKIIEYAGIVADKNKYKSSNVGDAGVYGVPVILYMALTIGIDIVEQNNRCSAFEKIFSLDGGIFDRFATESVPGYDECATHEIAFVKEVFYNILCETAYEMFKNEADGIFIDRNTYENIINQERNKMSYKTALWYDFPIDNLYEKGERIEFVHKSIYEYFVAQYLFERIIAATINTYYIQTLLSEEMLRKGKAILADRLKQGNLTNEILEHLKYKIDEYGYKSIGSTYFIKIFTDMIIHGMMSSNENCHGGYSLEKEFTIFYNMLRFLHLWIDPDKDIVKLEKAALSKLCIYVKLYSYYKSLSAKDLPDPILFYFDETSKLDLSNFDLTKCDLSGLKHGNINFKNCILVKANLNNSSFIGCIFENTNLKSANMQNTKLRSAIFFQSNVMKADFSGADITMSQFVFCHLESAIFTGAITDKTMFMDNAGFDTTIFSESANLIVIDDTSQKYSTSLKDIIFCYKNQH